MLYLFTWAIWVLRHAFDQTFAPAPKFNPDVDIPDLTGKVVVVTGGNSGIGYEICLAVLRKGAKVYMASRSEPKARQAITQLESLTHRRDACHYLALDLSDLSSVEKAARTFLELETRLDVLFCNAGVMVPDKREMTSQGYDLQFGTNVLGHHRFIQLLKPILVHPKEGMKNRIVLLSSIGHTLFPPWYAQAFHPELTIASEARDGLGRWGLYGHSKMGNILSAKYFDRELGDDVIVSACHPGLITTELYRTTPSFLTLLTSPMSKPASYGALTPLYLGCSPETTTSGGKYYVPWAREIPDSLDARARGEEGMRQAEVLDRWVGECARKYEAGAGGQ